MVVVGFGNVQCAKPRVPTGDASRHRDGVTPLASSSPSCAGARRTLWALERGACAWWWLLGGWWGGWWGGGGGGPCPLGAARLGGGRAGVPDYPRRDTQGGPSAGRRDGGRPGGCHGDAGSAAPRRGNKAVRPLLARAPPSAGASLPSRAPPRRRRRSHTRCRGCHAGQVRRARPLPGGLGAGGSGRAPGVGTGASTPPQGAGLRGRVRPRRTRSLRRAAPQSRTAPQGAAARAANFAAGAPDGPGQSRFARPSVGRWGDQSQRGAGEAVRRGGGDTWLRYPSFSVSFECYRAFLAGGGGGDKRYEYISLSTLFAKVDRL